MVISLHFFQLLLLKFYSFFVVGQNEFVGLLDLVDEFLELRLVLFRVVFVWIGISFGVLVVCVF
jgi:hypothetical protein